MPGLASYTDRQLVDELTGRPDRPCIVITVRASGTAAGDGIETKCSPGLDTGRVANVLQQAAACIESCGLPQPAVASTPRNER